MKNMLTENLIGPLTCTVLKKMEGVSGTWARDKVGGGGGVILPEMNALF